MAELLDIPDTEAEQNQQPQRGEDGYFTLNIESELGEGRGFSRSTIKLNNLPEETGKFSLQTTVIHEDEKKFPAPSLGFSIRMTVLLQGADPENSYVLLVPDRDADLNTRHLDTVSSLELFFKRDPSSMNMFRPGSFAWVTIDFVGVPEDDVTEASDEEVSGEDGTPATNEEGVVPPVVQEENETDTDDGQVTAKSGGAGTQDPDKDK